MRPLGLEPRTSGLKVHPTEARVLDKICVWSQCADVCADSHRAVRMRRLGACAILAASPFALLAANWSDGMLNRAHSDEGDWGNSFRGLRLSIALSSNTMRAGSEIRCAVYMGNFGTETAGYMSCMFPGDIYFGLDVIDAEGVAQTSHGRTGWDCAANFPVSIKPGAIDQLWFGTISDTWSLQAGSYTLRERINTEFLTFGDDERRMTRSHIAPSLLQAERSFTVTA